MSDIQFQRDPDIEKAAYELLGLSVEEIKLKRIIDLRELLTEFCEEQEKRFDDQTPQQQQHHQASPPPPSAPSRIEIDDKHFGLMTRSEIQDVLPLTEKKQKTETMKRLRYDKSDSGVDDDQKIVIQDPYLCPVGVASWCKEKNGPKRLADHLNKLLNEIEDLSKSIEQIRKIMMIHNGVLDEDDGEGFKEDKKNIQAKLNLYYIKAKEILDDLEIVIREREQTQAEICQVKNSETAKRMPVKTKALQIVLSAYRSRLECIHID